MNLGAIVEARGVAKGIKQGVEKGVKKGREELQREIARKLLVSGADQRFVEELTGLSSAVVAQLQEAVETA